MRTTTDQNLRNRVYLPPVRLGAMFGGSGFFHLGTLSGPISGFQVKLTGALAKMSLNVWFANQMVFPKSGSSAGTRDVRPSFLVCKPQLTYPNLDCCAWGSGGGGVG